MFGNSRSIAPAADLALIVVIVCVHLIYIVYDFFYSNPETCYVYHHENMSRVIYNPYTPLLYSKMRLKGVYIFVLPTLVGTGFY